MIAFLTLSVYDVHMLVALQKTSFTTCYAKNVMIS